MFKKILALAAAAALALTLAACGGTGEQLPHLGAGGPLGFQHGLGCVRRGKRRQPTVEEVPDTEFPPTP